MRYSLNSSCWLSSLCTADKLFIPVSASHLGRSLSDCCHNVAETRKRGRNLKSRPRQQSSAGGGGKENCRKEKYRDYYIQPDGCRSVKPYKMASCVGSDKCAAVKSRPRAVRFVCADGRKYKKTVENVKRCGRKSDYWG